MNGDGIGTIGTIGTDMTAKLELLMALDYGLCLDLGHRFGAYDDNGYGQREQKW